MTTASGKRIYVERPSSLATKRGMVLVGSPSFEWQRDSAQGAATTTWLTGLLLPVFGVTMDATLHARAVKWPAGEGQGDAPFILKDGTARPLVVWAERAASSQLGKRKRWWMLAADLEAGAIGHPSRVLDVEYIDWSRTQASAAVVGGEPAFAAPAYESTQREPVAGVVYSHRTTNGWAHSWIASGSLPAQYVTLGAENGQPFVIVIGTMPVGSERIHGVFEFRSVDGGASWLPPVIVYRFPNGEDGWIPRLETLADGTVHLMWAIRPRGVDRPASVAHYVRSRGAETWSSLSLIAVPNGTDVLSTTTGRDHELLLMVRQPGTGMVHVISWSGSARATECELSVPSLSVPEFGRGADGTIYVFIGTAEALRGVAGAGPGIPYLLASERQPAG